MYEDQGEVLKSRLSGFDGFDQFYRPARFTAVSDTLETAGCIHCDASYGHKINCPLINREAAEEASKLSDSFDTFFLRSLGIKAE